MPGAGPTARVFAANVGAGAYPSECGGFYVVGSWVYILAGERKYLCSNDEVLEIAFIGSDDPDIS